MAAVDTRSGERSATTQAAPSLGPSTELPLRQAVLAWTALVLGLLVVPVSAIAALGPAIRLPIVLAFVCVGPGAAFVSLVRMGDPVSSWATAFVLSLACNGIVASVMVWTGWWSAVGGYAVLALPTVLMAALTLWPAFRQRLPWSADPDHDRDTGRPSGSAIDWDSDIHWSGWPGSNASTTMLPRVTDGPSGDVGGDATSLLPRVGGDVGGDATSLLPRVGGDVGGDATSLLPRLPDGATTRLPRVPDGDHTALIPRMASGPQASRIPGQTARSRQRLAREDRHATMFGLGVGSMALGLWLVSLALSSVDAVDMYGLLPLMHPLYFTALGLCVVGFVFELARPRRRGWILLGHTAILILVMRATVPLLSPVPAYAWTYKHIGMVELFQLYGRITDPNDIYQQWPTLFALVAQVVDATSVDPLLIGSWAPVFFNMAFCVPLFALARTLATDPRVPYLTIFVYTATNWVGQDYLAPQAFAFALALGTLFVIVRWLRRTAGSGRPGPRLLTKVWAPVAAGLPPVPYTSKYAARAATVVMSVVFLVVVAAHQLTPYMVAMGAVALVALGLVRSYRIVPIIVGLALGYLVPRYGVVDDYGLFQGFNVFSNAKTVSTSGSISVASDGRVFNLNLTVIVALTVWGLAALAVVTAWRKLGPVAVPALLAFVPFGVLLAQSYGGEAIFRVYLFSAPWCAYLIASLVLRRRWLPHDVAMPAGAVALLVALLASLQVGQGQAMTTIFTRDDVAVARYLYSHAEPDAVIVLAANNFPTRMLPQYGEFYEYVLIGPDERLGPFELSEEGAAALDARFDDAQVHYLVFSPSMYGYLAYYGYMPAETLDALRTQIARSPLWVLEYQVGEAAIYRRDPGQSTSSPSSGRAGPG